MTIVAKKHTAQPSSVPKTRDPFSILREEMNDLVTRIWNDEEWRSTNAMTPSMDVSEEDHAYEISLDLPGVAAEDLDIEIQNNTVTIRGHRHAESHQKDKTFHRLERKTGSFARTVTLPCDIQEDEAVAQFNQGVLKLTVPKDEQPKAKKVAVRS